MQINVHEVLKGFDDKPLTFRESEKAEPQEMTVADALMLALTQGFEPQRDAKEGGKDKYRRFDLCMRCQGAHDSKDGKMTLTADEVVMIKDSAALRLPVVTYGRLVQIVEPDEKVN